MVKKFKAGDFCLFEGDILEVISIVEDFENGQNIEILNKTEDTKYCLDTRGHTERLTLISPEKALEKLNKKSKKSLVNNEKEILIKSISNKLKLLSIEKLIEIKEIIGD